MWLPWSPSRDEEAGLRLGRLKPGETRRPRRMRLWWVGAMRRAKAVGAPRRQPKTSAGGGGRRRVAAARVYGQRSVVKASFRRNPGKGAWVRHARYLARQSAQREAERGQGFDAGREGLDMAAVVREWERSDELMWSFIVSPEDAERVDLRTHVREVVAGMERDLDTRLEWVAIDHHNTDDAHVHLLIRGVREDGRVLTLDRDYVRRGIRELSQEILERELGPRSEREVLLARVRAEQEIERLQYLEKLGLARRVDERSWELAPEHEAELRRRQRERDIIKTRARERQRERGEEREQER